MLPTAKVDRTSGGGSKPVPVDGGDDGGDDGGVLSMVRSEMESDVSSV